MTSTSHTTTTSHTIPASRTPRRASASVWPRPVLTASIAVAVLASPLAPGSTTPARPTTLFRDASPGTVGVVPAAVSVPLTTSAGPRGANAHGPMSCPARPGSGRGGSDTLGFDIEVVIDQTGHPRARTDDRSDTRRGRGREDGRHERGDRRAGRGRLVVGCGQDGQLVVLACPADIDPRDRTRDRDRGDRDHRMDLEDLIDEAVESAAQHSDRPRSGERARDDRRRGVAHREVGHRLDEAIEDAVTDAIERALDEPNAGLGGWWDVGGPLGHVRLGTAPDTLTWTATTTDTTTVDTTPATDPTGERAERDRAGDRSTAGDQDGVCRWLGRP